MANSRKYDVIQSPSQAAVQNALNTLAQKGGKPILMTSTNNSIVIIVEMPLQK